MGYLYFDVETTGFLPEGKVTCVVTHCSDKLKIWATKSESDREKYTFLSESDLESLVLFMEEHGNEGNTVVSYNGASFDFKMLYNQTGTQALRERIVKLAKNHLDLHLACISVRGHRIKMDSLAKASLGKEKTGTGKEAIALWEKNQFGELFEYCSNDVLLLKDLFELGLAERGMQFESSRGNVLPVRFDGELGVCAMALSLLKPHKEKWMSANDNLLKVFTWVPQ